MNIVKKTMASFRTANISTSSSSFSTGPKEFEFVYEDDTLTMTDVIMNIIKVRVTMLLHDDASSQAMNNLTITIKLGANTQWNRY